MRKSPKTRNLSSVRVEARRCRNCPLWKNATQTVFGEGRQSARIMFIGEQPGDVEDRRGKPFVGPAGKLLDQALIDAGISRPDCYFTNAVKHFRGNLEANDGFITNRRREKLRVAAPGLKPNLGLLSLQSLFASATAAAAVMGPCHSRFARSGKTPPFAPREKHFCDHPPLRDAPHAGPGAREKRISTFCQGPHRSRTGLKPRALRLGCLLDTNSQADRRTP
jgi:DNA polymerase